MYKHIFLNGNAIVLSFLIMLSLGLLVIGSNNLVFAQDNNWYVGEGVKQNMYVTYRISDHDLENGRPYTMTIYFKEQDSNGNWIAPVTVVEPRGNILNGTFILSALDLTALGTSELPPEMSQYRGSYSTTLKWLAAFVPKPGLSLSAGSWGKTASIGGSEVRPAGVETITVPGFPQPVETFRISYYKGVDNNIWIRNEFPYPIKATTFADVTTGNPPIQYEYELIATGEGEPPRPEQETIIAQPPLLQRTQTGSYFVQLFWEPSSIIVGNDVRFGLLFMDNNESPITNVNYDFRVFNSNGTVIFEEDNRQSQEGTDIITTNFNESGNIRTEVRINSVSGVQSGEFIEEVTFYLGVQSESNSGNATSLETGSTQTMNNITNNNTDSITQTGSPQADSSVNTSGVDNEISSTLPSQSNESATQNSENNNQNTGNDLFGQLGQTFGNLFG